MDYYLLCKTHNVACRVTDDNGNPPNRKDWDTFYPNHASNVDADEDERCDIVLISERQYHEGLYLLARDEQ